MRFKRYRVAQTLRKMADTCNTVATNLEAGQIDVAKHLFRVCILEGYLAWLRIQYREWN